MPEASPPNSALATGTWVWRILGIAMGTATVVSLVKSLSSIDLYGVPAKIYQHYAWLRDIIFVPLVWLLAYFEITIPSWAKDLIAAYILVVAAHWHAFDIQTANRFISLSPLKFSKIPFISRILRFAGPAFWPMFQIAIWSVREKDFVPWQEQYAYYEQDRYYFEWAHAFRKAIVWNLAIIFVASISFFTWNYISSRFGPS